MGSCSGSYFHMHISWPTTSFYKKFRSLSAHHLSVLFGLGSISWCGHQIHISVPLNRLLDSGVDPAVMPCPQDLLSLDTGLWPLASGPGPLGPLATLVRSEIGEITSIGPFLGVNPSTGSIFLGQVAAHHFYVGIVFIISGIIALRKRSGYRYMAKCQSFASGLPHTNRQGHMLRLQKINSW